MDSYGDINAEHAGPDIVDVLVVGGGLGGLASAIAARQHGRSVLVLERDAGPSGVDTGITLWSFAMRALRQLGLDDAERVGAPLERLASYSANGRPLSDVDLRAPAREVGEASFDVHRADLQHALCELLGREQIRYGAACTDVRQEDDAAVAVLADGSEVRGRVLVGADGVRSVVRLQVAPKTRVQTSEIGVWRGVLELDERMLAPGMHLRIYGPGRVFGAARLDQRRVRWYAGGAVPAGTAGTWHEVAARFGGWCEPVASIIDASRNSDLLFNDTPRIRPLRRWARGRVALVGDAAHAALPTLGVSGGLALADGVALGAALGLGLDAAALDAYARERGAVGRRIQREAQAVALVLMPRRPRLLRVRDRLLKPPFAWIQERGVAHLSRGALTPAVADLAWPTGPANRRIPADPDVSVVVSKARQHPSVTW